jgi:hypothetical protein
MPCPGMEASPRNKYYTIILPLALADARMHIYGINVYITHYHYMNVNALTICLDANA